MAIPLSGHRLIPCDFIAFGQPLKPLGQLGAGIVREAAKQGYSTCRPASARLGVTIGELMHRFCWMKTKERNL